MSDHRDGLRPKRYQTVMFQNRPASVTSPTDYYPSNHVDLTYWNGRGRIRVQAVPHGKGGWTFPGEQAEEG